LHHCVFFHALRCFLEITAISNITPSLIFLFNLLKIFHACSFYFFAFSKEFLFSSLRPTDFFLLPPLRGGFPTFPLRSSCRTPLDAGVPRFMYCPQPAYFHHYGLFVIFRSVCHFPFLQWICRLSLLPCVLDSSLRESPSFLPPVVPSVAFSQ